MWAVGLLLAGWGVQSKVLPSESDVGVLGGLGDQSILQDDRLFRTVENKLDIA